MNNQKPKIFLSYAREDMGMAKKLYNDLKRYGLEVWLDTESLLPGDRWKDKIQEAIENSSYFIALLSSRSVNKKGFVQKELKTALEVLDLFPSSERFILPVRLDNCEVGERKLKEHHWVDLFPQDKYQNGLKKILQVISPTTFLLRSEPKELSEIDVHEMIKKYNFYDRDRNNLSKGFLHKYEVADRKREKIIYDELTGLVWQQSGSRGQINIQDANYSWRIKLKKRGFADFNDWRLPTLEEAMSLMEYKKNNNGLYISHIFNNKQDWIWTADWTKDEFSNWNKCPWIVDFKIGSCNMCRLRHDKHYVRAVRSAKSFEE